MALFIAEIFELLVTNTEMFLLKGCFFQCFIRSLFCEEHPIQEMIFYRPWQWGLKHLEVVLMTSPLLKGEWWTWRHLWKGQCIQILFIFLMKKFLSDVAVVSHKYKVKEIFFLKFSMKRQSEKKNLPEICKQCNWDLRLSCMRSLHNE